MRAAALNEPGISYKLFMNKLKIVRFNCCTRSSFVGTKQAEGSKGEDGKGRRDGSVITWARDKIKLYDSQVVDYSEV